MKIHELKLYHEFDAPVEQVWEAFNDHASLGKIMQQEMERIIDSTDPENINGLGSVRRIKLPLVPFEETIRKSVKPTCIEYQISKGSPLHHHYGTMQFKSLGERKSSLDYTIQFGSKIPLLGGLVKIVLQKGIEGWLKKYAASLKKH